MSEGTTTSRKEMVAFIAADTLCEVLLRINKVLPAPSSFFYYTNLCSQDSAACWNLQSDHIESQSKRCIEFIVEALKKGGL